MRFATVDLRFPIHSAIGNGQWASMMRSVIALIALLLSPIGASAFDVDFDIQPRKLAVGDAATCKITIRGLQSPPAPALPQIDGISISNPSQQSHVSIVNNQVDRSVSFVYRLVPVQPGNYTIGPFIYQAQGQSAQLPAIALEVLAKDAAGSDSTASIQQHLFAKLSTERTEVYNQETLDLTISVYYSGLKLARDLELLNMPASGLSKETLQDLGGERQTINGQVFEVRKFRLSMRALSAGKYRLEPTLRVGVVVEKTQRSGKVFDDPVFDRFFGNGLFQRSEIHPVTIPTEPIDIVVKTIPTRNQPEDFSGAVGTFQFEATLSPDEVNVGDPVTLTMRVAGYGNVESLSTPKIMHSERFKSYEARLTGKEISEDRRAGMKVFEQVFIPRTDAVSELPAATFTFFDPKAGEYSMLTQGPFPLKVHASSNDLMRIVQGASGSDYVQTEILGTDIIYLKPEPRRWSTRSSSSTTAVALNLAPALALLGVLLVARRRNELDRDVAKARRQRAPKAARAGMRKAQTALEKEDANAFYDAIWETLAAYVGHRFNLSPGDVTREKTEALLRESDASPAIQSSANQLFEVCELQRFSPSSGSGTTETMQGVLADLNALLRACEKLRKI